MKNNKKFEKIVIKEMSESDMQYVKRLKIEAQLRLVSRRLEKAHEWLPLFTMVNPDRKPSEIIMKLQGKRHELEKSLLDLPPQKLREMSRREKRGVPAEWDWSQDMEKIKEAGAVIQQMKKYTDPQLKQIWGRTTDGEPSSEPWRGTIEPSFLTTLPDIQWSNDGATFGGNFAYFPSTVSYSSLWIDSNVKVPTPFDWPFHGEEPNSAQIGKCIYLTFEIPAPRIDSLVSYEVPLHLNSMRYIHSDFTSLNISALRSVQLTPTITPMPSSPADFDWIEPEVFETYWEHTDSIIMRYKISYLSDAYQVSGGVPSRVHLGLFSSTTVENGEGFGFDELRILPTGGSSFPGLFVTIVPL